MKAKLIEIFTEHKKTGVTASLFFFSVEQARKFNPDFKDFRAVGCEKEAVEW